MAKKTHRFVWQFVIGLGFLSGIWTAIGIDPEDLLIAAAGSVADLLYPDPGIRYLFVILPTILLLGSIIGAYRMGKILGLAAVLIAYLAGLLILTSMITGCILLVAAIAVGFFAARPGRRNRLV